MSITLDASISNWYLAGLSCLSWMDVLCVDLGLPSSFNWKFWDAGCIGCHFGIGAADELHYTASVKGFPMLVQIPQPGK